MNIIKFYQKMNPKEKRNYPALRDIFNKFDTADFIESFDIDGLAAIHTLGELLIRMSITRGQWLYMHDPTAKQTVNDHVSKCHPELVEEIETKLKEFDGKSQNEREDEVMYI